MFWPVAILSWPCYGARALLSASSLQRLKEKWAVEYELWQSLPIEEDQLALGGWDLRESGPR